MDGDPAAVSSSEQTQGDHCFLSEFRSCVKVEVAVQAGHPVPNKPYGFCERNAKLNHCFHLLDAGLAAL